MDEDKRIEKMRKWRKERRNKSRKDENVMIVERNTEGEQDEGRDKVKNENRKETMMGEEENRHDG